MVVNVVKNHGMLTVNWIGPSGKFLISVAMSSKFGSLPVKNIRKRGFLAASDYLQAITQIMNEEVR